MNRVRTRSFGECVDELCGACIRLGWFDHAKEVEQAKSVPDLVRIAELDQGARKVNERHVEARAAIDEFLMEIMNAGTYEYQEVPRTFRG